jgi:methylmalonyl-CoA mutase N-terminal domain/subunit
MANNVDAEPKNIPNIMVYASPAKNGSSLAIALNQRIVVIVVNKIGWSLDFHVSTIASYLDIHLSWFLFALSMNTIASFTIIQVNAMNHIANDILYAFPVTSNQIFAPKIHIRILNIIIAGCV